MLAPKGFSQVIDSRAYIAARLAVSARCGILHYTLPMLVLAAASIAAAVLTAVGHMDDVWYVVSAGLFLSVGIAIALLWLLVFPAAVRREATRDYKSYDRLCNAAEVSLSSDELVIKTDVMTRRVPYANTRLCIEMPRRFVLVTDEDTILIMEKACFQQREDTELFFRDVFARRYVKERER